MERYSSYKDSGISWIGEIPEHWNFLAGKKIYLRNDGGVWGIDPLNNDKDTIVLRSTEQTVDGKLIIVNPAKRYLSEKEKHGSLLEENDLIITKSSGSPAHIGKTSIINKEIAQLECSYSNFMQRIRIKGCPMYYWFVFNSNLIKTQFDVLTTTTTGLKNISAKIIDRVLLPYPPLAEQEKIVSYLEDKTSKIDAYVADKEKEIELLQELKQKTIADAVTKGLNPDAKMKDSGISWIEEIPEHWEVRHLSQVSYEHYISNKEVHHQNLLSLSYGRIIRKDINTTEGLLPASFDTYQIVEEGNIVMRLTDLQNDHKSLRVGLVKEEGIVTSAYVCLGVFDSMIPSFLYNVLHSYDIKKLFYSMGGGLRQNLNWQGLKKLDIPLPPKDEQQAIVIYIEEKCEKIDKLASELQSEIDYLKEYKQRLIADCVTGQVNVQNI